MTPSACILGTSSGVVPDSTESANDDVGDPVSFKNLKQINMSTLGHLTPKLMQHTHKVSAYWLTLFYKLK